MSNWIIVFFTLALMTALLDFGGLAGSLSHVMKLLTALFVVLLCSSLIYSIATPKDA